MIDVDYEKLYKNHDDIYFSIQSLKADVSHLHRTHIAPLESRQRELETKLGIINKKIAAIQELCDHTNTKEDWHDRYAPEKVCLDCRHREEI